MTIGRVFRGLTAGLVLVGVGAPVRDVTAQPAPPAAEPPPAAPEDPAALFQRGKDAFAAGKYEEAHAAYLGAWELRKSYDVAANLGNVEVKLGKWRGAVEHLRYLLANLPPSLDAETRARAAARGKELLAEALGHVALLRVVVTPEGAEVSIDGAPAGRTPLAEELVLDPGKHAVAAKLEGYQPLEHAFEAKAGASETLRMTLVKAGEAAAGAATLVGAGAAKPASDAASGDGDGGGGPSLPLVIVGSVVGVGAVGAGIALLVVASGKRSDRDEASERLRTQYPPGICKSATPPTECTDVPELNDEAATFDSAGVGLLVGGGVVLTATVLYGVWPRGGGGEARGAAAPVALVPVVGPRDAALFVRGYF